MSDQGAGRAAAGAEAPTVAIADDHPVIRVGIRLALERAGFAVVAEASDCNGAVRAVLRERPNVCLLDVRMPGGGIVAARTIAERAPSTLIVMVTVSSNPDDVLAALRAGAVGYLPKDSSPDRLSTALCGVLKGEAALPHALLDLVLQRFGEYTLPAADPVRVGEVELTARESEILRMLRSGATTAEVSDALSLSPVTVRRHISAGVAKLGVADRDAAIRALGRAAA